MPRRSSSRGRSRSPSRTRSPQRDHARHYSRRSPVPSRRRRSRSEEHNNKDDTERLNPAPSKVIGVFGLSSYTEEKDVKRIFSKFGRINDIHIVYDRGTGRSRGFGFIYYDDVESAKEAKKETHGTDIDGQKVRVDFSLTSRPHERTPGIYMGVPQHGSSRGGSRGGSRSSHRRHSRSRSPYRRTRSPS